MPREVRTSSTKSPFKVSCNNYLFRYYENQQFGDYYAKINSITAKLNLIIIMKLILLELTNKIEF